MNNRRSIIFILGLTFILAACGGRNSANQSVHNYDISVEAGSKEVGKTNLMVTVNDENGNPVNDATVNIKGDMSHAGMQPVLGESSSANNGMYMIPYEWTMAGDWFVTIDVTLADGTVVSERVDFGGIGDESAMDGQMEEMDHSDMEMEEATDLSLTGQMAIPPLMLRLPSVRH